MKKKSRAPQKFVPFPVKMFKARLVSRDFKTTVDIEFPVDAEKYAIRAPLIIWHDTTHNYYRFETYNDTDGRCIYYADDLIIIK